MTTTIHIKKLDETYLTVSCDDESVRKDLENYFKFFAPNYQYTTQYKKFKKNGYDGATRLYNIPTGKIFVGLYWHILKFCKNNKCIVIDEYKPQKENVTIEDTLNFIDKLNIHSDNKPLEAYDYQIEAIHYTLQNSRALLLSPTSSGKTFIAYCLVMAYLHKKKRILISVPSTSLVIQFLKDFIDYSSHITWDAEKNCNIVFYGTERDFDKPITIGTWQSLVKLQKEQLETYDVIIGDEAHAMKNDVCSSLVKNCINASIRIGTTGTLDGKILSAIYLQGIFGPTYKTISIRELIDSGRIADPIINCLVLKYNKEEYKDLNITDYHEEIDWIVTNSKRQQFITKLTKKCEGNTLVLFKYVDRHGKPLYEYAKEQLKDKLVLYISGETHIDDREDIKQLFKEHNNIILFASFGVFSTGQSVNNIRNLIFGSPIKSRIMFFQSLGRGMRLYKGKKDFNVYDISDNLCKNGERNFTYRHAQDRCKLLESENIDFNIHEIFL